MPGKASIQHLEQISGFYTLHSWDTYLTIRRVGYTMIPLF
jgi:hypothetical protein